MATEPRGDISGKLPPQDLEAERCVLGSILLHNEAIDDVLQHIRIDCFYATPLDIAGLVAERKAKLAAGRTRDPTRPLHDARREGV